MIFMPLVHELITGDSRIFVCYGCYGIYVHVLYCLFTLPTERELKMQIYKFLELLKQK